MNGIGAGGNRLWQSKLLRRRKQAFYAVGLQASLRIADEAALRPLARKCWDGGGKADAAAAAATRQAQKFIDDLTAP